MDILLIAFVVLGAILASFIGVLAERAHTGESWINGRSKCNSCSTNLGVLDLVPVASWLSTFGRCGHCGIKLPVSYVAGEFVLALLFGLAYMALQIGVPLILFLAALSVLAYIVIYDLRHTIVPMVASVVFVILSAAFAYFTSFDHQEFGLTVLFAGVTGMAFFLLHVLSRGRFMGLGDSPIALGLALLVGFAAAFPGLLFSFWIGALCGIIILVGKPRGHRMGIEVPFVPFLAAGYMLAYFTQWNPLLLPL